MPTTTVAAPIAAETLPSAAPARKRRAEAAVGGAAPRAGHGDLSGLTCLSLRRPTGAADSSGGAAAFVDVFVKEAEAAVCAPGAPATLLVLSADAGVLADGAAVCGLFRGALHVSRRGTVDGGLSYAVLELASREALHRALATASVFPATTESGAPLGLRAWLANVESHQRADQRGLQAAADAAVAAFDSGAAAKAAAVGDLESRMQADGFTLVTKGVKPQRDADAGAGAGAGGGSRNAKAKAKRGSVVATDFYGFQNRESKTDALRALRARFEEDTARVARMKAERAFAPST